MAVRKTLQTEKDPTATFMARKIWFGKQENDFALVVPFLFAS